MPTTPTLSAPASRSRASLDARFGAFVAERFPFALEAALDAFAAVQRASTTPSDANALREPLRAELRRRLEAVAPGDSADTTPGVQASTRLEQAREEILDALDGFLHRQALASSFRPEEKREMLFGMLLTRAMDNRLKTFFSGGDVRYGNTSFQGKGFRSLGQEAIYAAPLRLRRGPEWEGDDGRWQGDVVAPMIRDTGAALAMRADEPQEAVRLVLSAQMGKADSPMAGRDLHVGDWQRGVLPPAAPLSIATLNVAGLAFAYGRRGTGQVAVSFIGEGGTSLGEWHEAINLTAARKLPAVFCVQNNQTALATPVSEQSSVRVFADKAAGYGIPGITLDGTDPEAIAAAFAWAAERARNGLGPALIELVAMRMCGHAHHDDMLYLGKEPSVGWDYPEPSEGGYVDRDAWDFWAPRDPIPTYARRLETEGVLEPGELGRLKEKALEIVEAAAGQVIDAPWPEAGRVGEGVFAGSPPERHVEVLEDRPGLLDRDSTLPPVEPGLPPDRKGRTFLEAVMLGVGDALEADPDVFVYGEDVGGDYGNAFLLLRPLLERFGDRIVNSTLAEGGVLGVCTGAALAGLRPIGEIQFNDFVATGFNQLVNNAAKIRYRWGASVPMVVRMPWGGLRRAGPYHSQNTEMWFYRTPGLKIVAPSTPQDARALLAAAVADPDPVLYYEHIGLYRDPRIKQALPEEAPEPLPLGRAALRRSGSDLSIVSYGAYVHVALRVAERLAEDGIGASVLDLRSLVPLDREALLAVARHTGKVLIAHEDTRRGGLGESLAATIQEEVFEYLDSPVRIVAALDTPVPYAPPLEDAFLPGEDRVERAARLLVGY